MRVPLTPIVAALDTVSPFLGGKALERRRGRAFKARLGANECLFGASPAALAAMAEGARDIGHYNDPTHFELREAIAARWGATVDHVTVAEGIDGLLALLVRAFLEPGTAAVTSAGAYPTFDYHVHGYGGRLISVPYLAATWSNDLDRMLAAVRDSGARLLFLANPDNPTGTMVEPATIRALLDRLPEDCLLLLDEAYVEFADPATVLPLDERRPNLVRLRTFSKAYGMAGIRVGYAVADPAIVAAFDCIRMHFGVAKLSQEMALAAYGDDAFLTEVLRRTAEGREHYQAIGRQAGIPTIASAANFVAFDFGDATRAQAMAAWLEEHDVFVRRPGNAPLDRLVRITVGPEPARDYLAQVILAGANEPALRSSSTVAAV